jgi:hypothetical protein
MTPEEQAAIAGSELTVNVVPLQVGNEMRVMMQLGGRNMLTVTVALTQDAARMVARAIQAGIDEASKKIITPTSPIHQA